MKQFVGLHAAIVVITAVQMAIVTRTLRFVLALLIFSAIYTNLCVSHVYPPKQPAEPLVATVDITAEPMIIATRTLRFVLALLI
jgi:hypothetical protein